MGVSSISRGFNGERKSSAVVDGLEGCGCLDVAWCFGLAVVRLSVVLVDLSGLVTSSKNISSSLTDISIESSIIGLA